jgi:hypothetical protein
MTPSTKKQTNFRIDPDIMEGLQRIKQRDGIPLSEQVRRALRLWLDEKGVVPEQTERKRAVTRKRPV